MQEAGLEVLPEVCRDWLTRWFGSDCASTAERVWAPWPAESVVRWCYLVADCSARGAAALTLRVLGSTERAGVHLALDPVVDEPSAKRAIAALEASADALQALGQPCRFLNSTGRVAELAYCLESDFRELGVLEALYLEGMFGKAGALDMSIGRSLTDGHVRDELLAVYRRVLLSRLRSV